MCTFSRRQAEQEPPPLLSFTPCSDITASLYECSLALAQSCFFIYTLSLFPSHFVSWVQKQFMWLKCEIHFPPLIFVSLFLHQSDRAKEDRRVTQHCRFISSRIIDTSERMEKRGLEQQGQQEREREKDEVCVSRQDRCIINISLIYVTSFCMQQKGIHRGVF